MSQALKRAICVRSLLSHALGSSSFGLLAHFPCFCLLVYRSLLRFMLGAWVLPHFFLCLALCLLKFHLRQEILFII